MLLKKISSNNILQIVLYLFTFSYSFFSINKNFNLSVNLLFSLLGIFSVWCLFNDKNKGFSLNKVFWLFNYTFFFLAPLYQFKNNTTFYIEYSINNTLYIKPLFLILIASVLYFFSYNKFANRLEDKIEFKTRIQLNSRAFVLISLLFSLLYLYLIKFNFDVLFYRPKSGWLKVNTLYGNLGYALVSIIRYIPFLCFLHYYFTSAKKDRIFYLLLLITLFISFPTSLSRGIVAAIYLPILLVLIPKLKLGHNFTLLYLLSIICFFPILNSFRNFKNGFKFNYELFSSGQFDAFQNFMLLIENKIITNGEQLLNNFQFFRSLKGSGQVLGEKAGYEFYNVAMPFIGEGYINFGYLGIVFFIVILALFNAWLDKKSINLISSFKAIYYVLIGFEFYLLRGDLGSSIKKISGFVLALIIIELLLFLSNRLIIKKTS